MNQKLTIVSNFPADSNKYLGHLMQVKLAHLEVIITFFQKMVWFIGFWVLILQILLTETFRKSWLSKNFFNFGVDIS